SGGGGGGRGVGGRRRLGLGRVARRRPGAVLSPGRRAGSEHDGAGETGGEQMRHRPAGHRTTLMTARRAAAASPGPSGDGTRHYRGSVADDEPRVPNVLRDMARWSEALAAIARTGLGFTQN